MERIWKRIGSLAFGAAVAAALSFGASTALASGGAGCTDPSADTVCKSVSACQEYCLTTPPGTRGLCFNGCCYCGGTIYP